MALEKEIFERLRGKTFEPTWKTAVDHEKVFAIDTPPPYPSGKWHIGAVAHYALIDVIARSRRMLGEKVLFPWGLDRNGINIELVVEKKYDRKMHTFDRQEFLDLCRKEIEPFSAGLIQTARRIGMSCDFENGYQTDSPAYRAMTQKTFIELWNKGLVVEDLRPNSYCPDCKTTIADAEVYYDERETILYHVRWDLERPVKAGAAGGTVDHFVIATTRPELIAACQVTLVHPEDERYQGLAGHGQKVKVPTYERTVEIRAHTTVDKEFGTGAMMICSYGDFTDVAMFRELSLPAINAIGMDGRMTADAGHLHGLSVKQARAAIVEKLKAEGRIVKEEKKQQKVPICERSRTPIEIISLKEWYVKQVDALDALRGIAEKIDFHPDKHRGILLDWVNSITIDWPVSRRRYFHTEIPVWYCKSCGEAHVPNPGPYYQPWKQAAPSEISKCRKCGHAEFAGEEKVFDTWMDSSASNLYVLHYHDDPAWFNRQFPCSLRPQGRDIVRTWLHYTLLKSHLILGKPGFEHVWITGLGMDEKGRKMSKSLGNVIDPDEVLNAQGADAFRFWAASECTIGDDFRISKDRISGAGKFLTKLFNVARFISSFDAPPERPAELHPVDEWILAEVNKLTRECRDGYEGFDFFTPANALRNFVWNVFAPHYLEMVKGRAYDKDPSALWTLHEALRRVLLNLAPVCPFSTTHVHHALYDSDVHDSRLPDPIAGVKDSLVEFTAKVEAFNSEVWKIKKDKCLPLNAPLSGVQVPAELAAFKDAFVGMHRLQ